MIEDLRDYFPKMPDEVFDIWISPFTEEYGWPILRSYTDTKRVNNEWRIILNPFSVTEWASFTWDRLDIDLTAQPLTPRCIANIKAMTDFCASDIHTSKTYVSNTKERYKAYADFIRAHKRIPKPIIALLVDGHIDIVDGYHRISALLHLGIPNGYKVPTWIPKT